MNKYSAITAIAIIVIVTPFVFSAMNIVGSQQLEYRWHSPGTFSFFTMLNDLLFQIAGLRLFKNEISKFFFLISSRKISYATGLKSTRSIDFLLKDLE